MKFSVIVPVYNVEQYLDECLESLMAQTLEAGYEVILIDDGSTDGSGARCDRWAAEYEVVQVIHTENRGLSAARNIGMELAKGSYLLFVDPDDLVMPSYFSQLDRLTADGPEMVKFGFENFDRREVWPGVALEPFLGTGREFAEKELDAGRLPVPAVWTYGYSRDFIDRHHVRFREDFYSAEDFELTPKCLRLVQILRCSGVCLYRYRFRAGGLSRTPNVRHQYFCIQASELAWLQFPTDTLANDFGMRTLKIGLLPDDADTRKLEQFILRHREPLDRATDPRCRIARAVYRVFGVYRGAVLLQKLIALRNRLRGVEVKKRDSFP